ECTAQSASPRCIASSSSLRNRPLPPIAASERSRISSPRMLSGSSSTSRPGCAARSRAATCSVCHRASGLLRVAMRSRSMPALSRSRGPGAGTALQVADRRAQLGHAAAADVQRPVAVAQDRVYLAVDRAPELDQLVARHQAVAVDAHETLAELLLQRLE